MSWGASHGNFGRYTVLQKLSAGGMAEVYLAVARGPGDFKKFVTLKRILPELRSNSGFVARFLDEARISASLSHANIAQVFDLGNKDGELFLAMEFVPGEDLWKIIKAEEARGRRVPVGLSLMLLRDTLFALQHAHTFIAPGRRSPIIHGDISPRNLMMTYEGTVKVVDFGMARAISATDSDLAYGSSGYVPPERIHGGKIDARSDVFAIGVIMHELLTGRRLFTQIGADGLAAMRPEDVQPPNVIEPNIPKPFSDIVMQALAFNVNERWATARDMAKAIDFAADYVIWDSEQAAEYMQKLFADNLERTRHVMHLATHARSTEDLTAAAAAFDGATDIEIRPDDGTSPVTTRRPRSGVSGRRYVVVAVDDSAAALQLLKAQLEPFDIDVVTCSEPQVAIDVISASNPDAILLDVLMPDIDGFELCKLIRAMPKARSLPIVFVSAVADLDERKKCLAAGGDDFIRKPYVPSDLAARLRSMFDRAAIIRAD